VPAPRRQPLRLALAALLAALAALLGPAVATDRASAAPTQPQLGVFVGGGNPSGVRSFGTWLGRQPTVAVDFFARSTWADIESPTWWLQRWQGSGLQVVYSVAMLPENGCCTLAEGARGTYNDHFVRLAQRLVQYGYGSSTIRLGWEFNGGWYVWSAIHDPVSWPVYWRQIVTAMRSVPGAAFTFDWNPVPGGGVPLEQVYPGDDYVDVIGMDVYDVDCGTADPEARWANAVWVPYGLEWHRRFAAEHGKPMSFPEWGVWRGGIAGTCAGGDNPRFVERMHEWVHQANVAYHAYFEFDAPDGDHELMSGAFPQSAARFRALFRVPPAVPTVPVLPANPFPAPAPPPPAPQPPPPAAPASAPTAIPPPAPGARRPAAAGTRTGSGRVQRRSRVCMRLLRDGRPCTSSASPRRALRSPLALLR
jgi:hypothetical protein